MTSVPRTGGPHTGGPLGGDVSTVDPARGIRARRPTDEGSATVLTVAAAGVVVVVLAAALVLVGVVRDVHRARAAADLAALAAAGPALSGAGADCGAAMAVAHSNGGDLAGCEPSGDGSVVVTVQVARVSPPAWRWLPTVVTARARAGVVDDDG